MFIPVAVFARFWAKATGTRELQARRIAASEEKLRDLSSRLLRIQEDERRAISREIHDEFGQQVTAINLDLKLAERNIEAGRAKPHLVRAVSENETLLHSLHEFATRLRPAVLDDLGLLDAVESHLEEFQQRTGIDVEAELEFSSVEIPVDVADHAYRLLQESLNNVLKHAQATRVRVAMSVAGDDPSYLFVSVRDNGRGYAAHNHRGGLGLIGMRERVELLAGELRTHSDLDRGTLIEIKLPIHPRYDAERSS